MKRSYFKSRGERLGPSFLIFGSRNIDEGLFHDEVKQFQKEGKQKFILCMFGEIIIVIMPYFGLQGYVMFCSFHNRILNPIFIFPQRCDNQDLDVLLTRAWATKRVHRRQAGL